MVWECLVYRGHQEVRFKLKRGEAAGTVVTMSKEKEKEGMDHVLVLT